MTISPRETALRALTLFRLRHMRSDEALNTTLAREGERVSDPRDAALASRIFYGVIQNRTLIDDCIAAHSSVRPAKLHPQILDILRLSVYQLLFLSKIPVNAAVSEGVSLAKRHANPRAAGLVNAVLRRISENRESLLEPEEEKSAASLAKRYSHPLWLVEAFIERLDLSETETLLKLHNEDAPLTVRVNTLRADVQSIMESLTAGGAEVRAHWLDGSLEIRNARRLHRLPSFTGGGIYVQDPAAALAVMAARPEPGMLVVDGCAAPGGKSVAAAVMMGNTGRIISCDISDRKLQLIRENADRAGAAIIETRLMDAQNPHDELIGQADLVIADVPCSGFGVIRKKPEIRCKTAEEIKGLPALQLSIVRGLSRCVRPGGTLLYSTCTLLREENEEVVDAFLERNPHFSPEAFELPPPAGPAPDGFMTLWPQRHETDGFFIAKLRRRQ